MIVGVEKVDTCHAACKWCIENEYSEVKVVQHGIPFHSFWREHSVKHKTSLVLGWLCAI